jgi:hypothetical protein
MWNYLLKVSNDGVREWRKTLKDVRPSYSLPMYFLPFPCPLQVVAAMRDVPHLSAPLRLYTAYSPCGTPQDVPGSSLGIAVSQLILILLPRRNRSILLPPWTRLFFCPVVCSRRDWPGKTTRRALRRPTLIFLVWNEIHSRWRHWLIKERGWRATDSMRTRKQTTAEQVVYVLKILCCLERVQRYRWALLRRIILLMSA